ncbi:MAG: hypothetical protein ACRENU_17115 [Gemmatimonadaceae bacterium]
MRIRLLAGASLVGAVACATAVTRDTLIPIPDHTARRTTSELVRGTEREASRIPAAEEYTIVAEVLRRFYRPMMQQARWIDPKPLAHERTRQADSLVQADYEWAHGIVQAAAVARVCALTEANERCRGLPGGVLRFSSPYAVGAMTSGRADSALVYARYTPRGPGPQSEMEFFLTRVEGRWWVTSKRTLPEIVASAPPKYVITDAQEAVDSLLAADRAFSAAGKSLDVSASLVNTFVSNVVLQGQGRLVRGRDSASSAMAAAPDNAGRLTWTPVRGGVSSDLQHGFTFGYTTLTRPDGTTQPGKYVAYWMRGAYGWRIAAYKRVPRAAGDVSLSVMPASLPTKGLPRGDEASVQRWADELSLAEHAFSRDATPMGLGPAFAKWGAQDAVNTGGARSAEFVRGPEAIAKSVSEGWTPGSSITWAPEQVMVSMTGDLGITFGTIKVTTPAGADRAETTREFPFFTIWKRAWPTDPWRYVAE